MIRKLKRAEVWWLDARTYGGWVSKRPENKLMSTLGYLLGVSSGELVLAMTHDPLSDTWGDMTTIPVGCVQRLEIDGEPTSLLNVPDIIWGDIEDE